MNYNEMMADSIKWIFQHIDEEITADKLGRMYAYEPEYFCYLFSCYCKLPLDSYLSVVRSKKMIPQSLDRELKEHKICAEYRILDEIELSVHSIKFDNNQETDPLKQVEVLLNQLGNQTRVILWHSNHQYCMQYYMGVIRTDNSNVTENMDKMYVIKIPKGEYVVFYLNRECDSKYLADTIKDLMNYIIRKWLEKNEEKVESIDRSFVLSKENKVYLYLPLLPREQWKLSSVSGNKKNREIQRWLNYIDENITENLSIEGLAKKFFCSKSSLRAAFNKNCGMSATDYIRRRRLEMAAKDIRENMSIREVAKKYKYHTVTGFTRAFEREFLVLPSAYSRAIFKELNIHIYSKAFFGTLQLMIVSIKDLKMIGKVILNGKDGKNSAESQVQFWLNNEFPCSRNTRLSNNRYRREDKISLWWHNPEIFPTRKDLLYLIGPVVEDYQEDEIAEGMLGITIYGGKYAIFKTGRQSDRKNLAETIRMFTRCVFHGWLQEIKKINMLDNSRCTFQRYVDDKILVYIPLK